MFSFIKTRWQKIAYDLTGTDKYWQKSPSSLNLKRSLQKALKKYAQGKLIDIGAGRLTYKDILKKYCQEYQSLDFKKTHPDLTYIEDIKNLSLENDSFDTIFCSQVLEHVPEPSRAISELKRILKKNGYLILTTPFLGYLHNEPYDFQRFTKYALEYFLQKENLKIVILESSGGFFSFLGYVWSTFILSIFYKIPFLWIIIFYLNYILAEILIFLDKITKNSKIFPLNYLIVAQKK